MKKMHSYHPTYIGKQSTCLLLLVCFLLLILILPHPAAANSAEPPTLIIFADDPLRTIDMTLYEGQTPIESNTIDTAWERQFRFFKLDISKNIQYRLVATTPEKTFEIDVPYLVKQYRTTYKFNPDTGTLTEGLPAWRSVLLVGIRLTTTLLIEAGVFYLFLFRERESWHRFIIINVITQGVLNLWLNDLAFNMGGYIIFALVFGEIFVFLAEALSYAMFIREHKMSRRIICSILANAASLFLGGLLIFWLPV